MKGGQILLAALILLMVGAGCSKQPPEGTTYQPPPNVQPAKKGTLYLANTGYYRMKFYIGTRLLGPIDGGTYLKKDVPPGLYTIKAIQDEGVKPGEKPRHVGRSVTVVADHMIIVSLP